MINVIIALHGLMISGGVSKGKIYQFDLLTCQGVNREKFKDMRLWRLDRSHPLLLSLVAGDDLLEFVLPDARRLEGEEDDQLTGESDGEEFWGRTQLMMGCVSNPSVDKLQSPVSVLMVINVPPLVPRTTISRCPVRSKSMRTNVPKRHDEPSPLPTTARRSNNSTYRTLGSLRCRRRRRSRLALLSSHGFPAARICRDSLFAPGLRRGAGQSYDT